MNAEGRNLVENVTLDLSGSDTRLAYDGKYTWEAGDQIGACLMDEITADYNTPNKIWRDRFDLVNYIQTNYKFTRDDAGTWATEAKMLEGNYFFAYPYDANNGVRDAYKFSAKAQTMTGTSTEDLQKAYAENNSFIGFGKVEKGASEGETVRVNMLNVFGATGITIKTTGTQTYTIERVVLRGTKVSTEATVDPTTCTLGTQYNSNAESYSGLVAPAIPFNVAQYTSDTDDMYVNGVSTGDYVPTWTAYSANNALRDVLDYTPGVVASGAEVTLEGGNVVNSSTSINVIVMVAPTDLTTVTNEAVLDIYTDKGIIRDIQLNHRYSANDATTGGNTTNVLTDVALTEVGTGNKVEVTFDDTSVDVPASMTIYSNEDLANLIHWNAGTAATLEATLQKDVTLSKAMYDELKNSQITSLTIKGTNTVTIDSNVADGALNDITYENNGVTVKGGTQSLASNLGTALTINSGATVNVTKKVTLNNNITNKGTLNVNGGNIEGTGTITNQKTMTVASGRTVKNAVTNGVSASAKGTITNTGTILSLTNSAYGTVTNTGSIGSTSATTSTNAGTINNNGNGRVYLATNTGEVYANDLSATTVTTNTNGSIIITDLDSDGNFITDSGAEGAIVQEITADANTDAVDTRANTIWLSAALNVEAKDADGNYKEEDALKEINLIATGAARINGHQKGLQLASIAVADDASLVLSNENVTIVTTTVEVGDDARLTINSNASLKPSGTGAITVTKGTDAVVENFSSSTTIQ